ncbi:prepilin peptidase [Nitrosophilus kaiyonis]|uniref:prepilin peptidase n=1 Tax=Nitrosophilus kaiyonis TaxID=2930200 RepID=UPI00248F4EF9|nr:prepilin peptidase [Nitrosophilus kaiyonis]
MTYFIIFIFGLVFGSFLNVLIVRIPKGENIAYPPSHCPVCKKQLKWWHNIPVISWIILKGECYFCKSKISLQYPLIELITAIIFVIVFLKNGINIYSLIIALTFSLLLTLSMIDFLYKAVPDSLNLLALSLSIFSSANILENLKNALLMAGGFSLLRFYVSYYVSLKENFAIKKEIKKAPWLKSFYPTPVMIEAMGEGDIIVAATIGAILGIKLSIISFFLSAIFAIPASLYLRFSKKEYELPYIPFLAISLIIVYTYKDFFNNLLEWIING